MNNKHGLRVRSDSVYCPLPLSLDSYWNCLTNCYHCFFRRLNNVWGTDLRPTNPEAVRRKLINGLNNKTPKSPLAWCLRNKKTIRVGDKTDPYQKVELKHKITQRIIKTLIELKWSFVIQTRFTSNMLELNGNDLDGLKDLGTLMPVISPGLDKDWDILERKRTTKPEQRLKDIRLIHGINTGVNGEPFIPGYHTPKDFENTLKLLKKYKIESYNTYNLHLNEFNAKRIHKNTPLDIEKIWFYNQDENWKPILQKLIDLSKKYNIRLGCPDFVNTGPDYVDLSNTCCGINVPNPCTFNSHHFKKLIQSNPDLNTKSIFKLTWDGSANKKDGLKVIREKSDKFFTLQDAGFKIP